jgi:uncharacterized protein (DUF2236 family)
MSVVNSAASESAAASQDAVGPAGEDLGLLGPDSVAWKVLGHPAGLVGGMRALIVQALEPRAMAGVADFDSYRKNGLRRLRRTSYYVLATAFGDTETAHAAARRVRAAHKRVRGIDPITGSEYSADDPDTQLWVHCVEWHSFLASYRAFAGPLTREEQDQFIFEGARIAALVGVPEETVPQSVEQMRDYFDSMLPRLCVSAASRDAIDFVTNLMTDRGAPGLRVPVWLYAQAAVAITPRHLRQLAGIDRPRAIDHATIAAIRPALTALTLPGVRRAPGLLLGGEVSALGERARNLRQAA